MIRIFGAADRDFTSNGDIVIRPSKSKLHKADNGDYYVDFECSTEYIDYIKGGNIVVVDTPQGAQAFRFSNPEITRTKITSRAWHVFYDTENYLIADSYVENKSCNDALDHLNTATDPESAFSVLSDVKTIDSYRCVRTSLYEAIKTVLERWGGHLVRNNFKIEIRNNIGTDNGVVIRYRKNLKQLSCVENWDNVVTKLLPVGADGLLLNAIDSGASIYVESERKYSIPYTKTVSFDQSEIERDNYRTDGDYTAALVADLKKKAMEYVEQHSVPEVNYTLKANVDKVTDIGDIINVIDDRLGIDLTVNVIGFDYDCISGKYTEIEFGNFKKSLDGFAGAVTATAQKAATVAVGSVAAGLGDAIATNVTQSLSASYVAYDGTKILVLDALPKEDAKNVIMINNMGIAFSDSGINGTFKSCWSIDGTLNMQEINVINLMADLIKGGTLKLGSADNQSGTIELFNDSNQLTCTLDSSGLKMYATDGSYVILNDQVGLTGYDALGNPVYWVTGNEFHMSKAVVETEINFNNKIRFVPVTIADSTGNITNDGIGVVSAYSGGES